MARYDYKCEDCGETIEAERPIAERAAPVRCSCGGSAVFTFHPTAQIGVPRAFATRWSDVAPLDANGKPMSFTETVRSGKFDRFRREDREDAEKAHAAYQARMEPVIRKRAMDTAFKKIQAAGKRGIKLRSDRVKGALV